MRWDMAVGVKRDTKGPAIWRGARSSARSALAATLVDLVAAAIGCVVIAVSLAQSANDPGDLLMSPKTGRPSMLVGFGVIAVIVLLPQSGAALGLLQTARWARVLGAILALAMAGLAGLFLGAVALQFALTGPSMFMTADAVGTALLLPAALTLVLNARAVYLSLRRR